VSRGPPAPRVREVAALLWAGTVRLLGAVGSHDFNRAKATAAGGLSLGFLLYAVGFVSVGGEWFAMWQSQIWNGEHKALEFIGMIAAVLIVVMLSDPMPE
jgi:predicted small integral membrane protein